MYIQCTEHDNSIIIANTYTGKCIKTSKVYKDYIDTYYNKKEGKLLYIDGIPEDIKANLQKLVEILTNDIEYFSEQLSYKPYLKSVYISLTDRCNLKCKHCYYGCKDTVSMVNELPFEEIVEIIMLIKKLNPREVILTGGEPLLRKDILKILVQLRNNFTGKIALSTNGTLINSQNAKVICECVDGISISLDGYDEKSCSYIRGTGVFTKVLNNIKILKKYPHININITAVYSKIMEGHKSDFEKLGEELSISTAVRNLFFEGRANSYKEELMPKDYWEQFLEDDQFNCGGCHPGEQDLYISSCGDIYPCPLLVTEKLRIGSFKESDIIGKIQNISENSAFTREIEKLRPWNKLECKKCKNNIFCQTCLAKYLEIVQTEDFFEKYCKKRIQILDSKIWN